MRYILIINPMTLKLILKYSLLKSWDSYLEVHHNYLTVIADGMINKLIKAKPVITCPPTRFLAVNCFAVHWLSPIMKFAAMPF